MKRNKKAASPEEWLKVLAGLVLALAATAVAGYAPGVPARRWPPRASHSGHYPWQGLQRDHFRAGGPGSASGAEPPVPPVPSLTCHDDASPLCLDGDSDRRARLIC